MKAFPSIVAVSLLAWLMTRLIMPTPASAVIIEITPADDLRLAIRGLLPGDELVLGGGTYSLQQSGGSWFFEETVTGTFANPIVIRAKNGEVPVLQGDLDASQNTINLGGSHFVLRGLEITGGSDGLELKAPGDFITIEDCLIHDVAGVGIRADDLGVEYAELIIRNTEVRNTAIGSSGSTGEGIRLGCNTDACRVAGGIIEGNYIHDTLAGTLGGGIDIKFGTHGLVVRDNVIHAVGMAAISVQSTAGNGPANIIERNLVWDTVDNGIDVNANVVVRNNIVLGAGFNGIHVRTVSGVTPAAVTIAHNTVLFTSFGAGIKLNDASGSVSVVNNAIYAPGVNALRLVLSPSAVILGNFGEGATLGVSGGFDASGNLPSDFVNPNLTETFPIDLFPSPGSGLVGSADPAELETNDFNGTLRAASSDAGAYLFDAAGNPGWSLSPGLKPVPIVVPVPSVSSLGVVALTMVMLGVARRALRCGFS